jgi:8-oxo-dGTP pyrophosphatase MutT (NUDIX family)
LEIPTSIKGVLIVDGKVLLMRNARDEWELPGGRPEIGETPEVALVREIAEELSIAVTVGPRIDAYVFEVLPHRNVSIVTYGCTLVGEFTPQVSEEHLEYGVFPLDDLPAAGLPNGYRRSIERWQQMM